MLAAGALVASRALARAASRYRLFGGAFAIVALVGPAALAVSALRPAADGGAAPAASLEPIAFPVLGLAAALAVTLLVELALDVVRLRRIKRAARPVGRAAVRNATIGISPVVPTPTAIGYLHPAIVVPADFRARVDAGEWDAIVAHECAHLARRDDWAKALQSAVLRAGWWLPGLWLLSRGLDLERELASDERAAGTAGARRYAACLLRLATGGAAESVAPALFGRRSQIAIRVERLLRPVADPSPLRRGAAMGAFTAVVLAVVAVAFAAAPAVSRHAAHSLASSLAASGAAHRPFARVHGHRARPKIVRPIQLAAAPVPKPTVCPRPLRVVTKAPKQVALAVPRPGPVQRRTATVAVRSSLESLHGTVVAYLPHFRCSTCFTPLRQSDGGLAVKPQPAATASPAVIATSEETGSGPATTSAGLLWLRMPRALILP